MDGGAFGWPQAAQFVNRKQHRLLFVVACGFSGAMAEVQYPLLIYCGSEGGTAKSRIFAIQYMLDVMHM